MRGRKMSGKLTQAEVNKYAFYTITMGIGIAVPHSYATIFSQTI
jgi:biotin-(acetyl-CoA carboxylase) ligase